MKKSVTSPMQDHHQRDADLAANQDGQLSPQQRRQFAAARVGEHTLGALVIMFAFAWIVNTLRLAPSLTIIGAVVSVILIALALLLIYRLRHELHSTVKSVDGRLTVNDAELLAGSPLRQITVGDVAFYVKPSTAGRLNVDTVYRAYYLPRSPYVGGNLLLTVEHLAMQE